MTERPKPLAPPNAALPMYAPLEESDYWAAVSPLAYGPLEPIVAENERIAWTDVTPEWSVSTVRLGYARVLYGTDLYETITFRNGRPQTEWRWESREQAHDGHAALVHVLLRELGLDRR